MIINGDDDDDEEDFEWQCRWRWMRQVKFTFIHGLLLFWSPRIRRDDVFTKQPLQRGAFTHRSLLHTEAFYTRKLLHREAFTQRSFYIENWSTEKFLHTKAVSHTQTTHTHTRLLRTVIANFVVECILRAKTLGSHLTGTGRWRDPKKYQKATIAIANVVEVKNCLEKIVEIGPRLRQRTYRTWKCQWSEIANCSVRWFVGRPCPMSKKSDLRRYVGMISPDILPTHARLHWQWPHGWATAPCTSYWQDLGKSENHIVRSLTSLQLVGTCRIELDHWSDQMGTETHKTSTERWPPAAT